MISRAACAPRICLACRLSLAQRSVAAGFRALPLRDGLSRRLYASNTGPQDKAMIEAMITGQISEEDAKRMLRKSKIRDQRKKGREALPDWGLTKPRSLRDEVDAAKARGAVKPIGRGKEAAPRRNTDKDLGPFTKPELEDIPGPLDESIFDLETSTTKGSFKYGPHNPLLERDDDTEDTLPSRFPRLSSLNSRFERRRELSRENRTHTTPGFIEGLESDLDHESLSEPQFEEPSDQTSAESLRERRREVSIDDSSEIPTRREPSAGRRDRSMPRGFGKLLHDEPIGISALGQPTSAIVINNPNQMRPERKPSTEIEAKTLEDNMRLDWESFMAMNTSEKAESSDEVFQNINELRPKDTRVLRMKEFEKLCNGLLTGFTSTQLRDYYRDHKTITDVEDENVVTYPWVVKQIPWTPTKSLPSDFQTQKQGYAQRIIFQAWNLAIQDYVDDLGRAHVWIRPELFPLITQGSNPVLETLRQDFLVEANNERMSTTSSECRINITARKPSTYAMLARLDETFSRLKRRTIPIGQFTNTSREELSELSRITNTSIELKPGKPHEIEVSWLSASPAEEDIPPEKRNETPADIVFRLLTGTPLRAQRSLAHTAQSIPEPEPEKDLTGYFADFSRETKSMAWREKLRKWSRYVQPVAISGPHENSLHLPTSASLPEAPAVYQDATNLTSATFGHILHSVPSTNWPRHRRILCPVIPHPASFSALKADNDEALVQSTAIILNFSTLTGLASDPSRKGPALRLHLPVDADADLSNFSLPADATFNAVIPWHTNDVMLPSQSVDVRLAHQRLHPLDIKQTQLKDFLAVSEFNLLEGRLRTPSHVTFTIPDKLLDPKCLGKVGKKTIDMPYMFYGLEIHQTVEIAWRGHTLRYSSIEAGLHGGQRQELTLQALGPPSASAFNGDNYASFLQCVEDIATGKVFSWDEGYKAMKERQFEDYSYDLPEEALGEDFLVTEVEENEENDNLDFARVEEDANELDVAKVKEEESLDDIFAAEQYEDEGLDDDVLLTKEEEEAMEKEINALLNLAKTSESPLSAKTDGPDEDPFAVLEAVRKENEEVYKNKRDTRVRSSSPEDESRSKAVDEVLATIQKALEPDHESQHSTVKQEAPSPVTDQDESGFEPTREESPQTKETTTESDKGEEKDKK